MTSAFIGEVRAFTFNFVPEGWLECNGASYPVSSHQALFSVIGNAFGGDARAFNVPNLMGRAAIGAGAAPNLRTYERGANGGEVAVALEQHHTPTHNHDLMHLFMRYSLAPAQFKNTPTPNVSYPTRYIKTTASTTLPVFTKKSDPHVPLIDEILAPFSGEAKPHENRQPYTVLRFCINYDGQYPSPD